MSPRARAAPAPPALEVAIDPGVDAVIATVTPSSGATNLWLSRIGPSGENAYVRGCNPLTLPAAGPGAEVQHIRDFEPPIGLPLTYTAILSNDAGEQSFPAHANVTIPADDTDDPWLVDIASPSNTLRISLESMNELSFEAASGLHYVLNRRTPIVTSDVARAPKFELVFATLTDDDYDRAHGALGNGVPFLLRTPPGHDVQSMYLIAADWKEQRPSRIAMHDARRFVVAAVQVDRPDPILYVTAALATYAGIKDAYDTYAQLKAARATYDDVLHDPAGAESAVLVPWPPDDV